MPTMRCRRLAATPVLLLLFVALTCLPGCYRRVVGVKNDPGYEGRVYEPNLEESGKENGSSGSGNVDRTDTKDYSADSNGG